MVRYAFLDQCLHMMFESGNIPVIVGSNQHMSKCCECHTHDPADIHYVTMSCYWCRETISDWHKCPAFMSSYVKWRIGIPQPTPDEGYYYGDD